MVQVPQGHHGRVTTEVALEVLTRVAAVVQENWVVQTVMAMVAMGPQATESVLRHQSTQAVVVEAITTRQA
jgi:hypothetical protein